MTLTEKRAGKNARLAPEARRAQIVAATIACLARHSPDRWTLRQVSRDLGVAPSLVNYFFESWSDLIVASYRHLAVRFEADFEEIVGETPEARLHAAIDQYFSAYWMSDEVAGAYIACWALARRETALQEEMTRFTGAIRDTLSPLVEDVVQDSGAAARTGEIADQLYFLLNGLWYEIAVNPAMLSPEDAKAKARAFLAEALSR